jgi:hypothetical protein
MKEVGKLKERVEVSAGRFIPSEGGSPGRPGRPGRAVVTGACHTVPLL